MNLVRKLSVLTCAVGLAGAGLIAGGAAANASPTCTTTQTSSTAGYVVCSGLAHYRVDLTCYDAVHDSNSHAYGPWVTSGKSATACAASHGYITFVGWDYY